MRACGVLAALLSGLAVMGAAFAQQAGPQGRWVTASGNAEVEIAPCGQFSCGRVMRVLANNAMTASGPSHARPLTVGALLISALRPDGSVWRGHIFNREDGRTYDCVVRVRSDGALDVRAYIIFEAFGRSQTWRRAYPSSPRS